MLLEGESAEADELELSEGENNEARGRRAVVRAAPLELPPRRRRRALVGACAPRREAQAAPDAEAARAEPQTAVAAPAATAAVFMSDQRRLDIAANRETLMAVLASLPDDNIVQAHAAKFFVVTKTKGQQVKAQCMACGSSVSSTDSNRLVKH